MPHDLLHVDQTEGNVPTTQSTAHAALLHARVSAECGHATPPDWGSTVARLRCCEPPPHDTVHVDQALKAGTTQSTGHAWVLQFLDEVAELPSSVHSAPPLNGAGLSQVRVIDCVPVPQLLEQVPYVQLDQAPSMKLRPESVQSPLMVWVDVLPSVSTWSNSWQPPGSWCVGCFHVHAHVVAEVCVHLKESWRCS